ncbi:MAG TPA: efflux RND transporter permease subunit, partial [bacterium]|nr:efflux RND transporter permease subunit [bacterium]
MSEPPIGQQELTAHSWVDRLILFCLQKKIVVFVILLLIVWWGLMVAPFDWHLGGLPRDPVAVDAIPDIGENQQIVFTEWMGRSPRDVEDQITYPLTSALLGVPGVKTIRSYSMFEFSTIYVIFHEKVDFYWSRSRILEKLNSLPSGLLPEGATPILGPDATALGQVFWYTLEGRDKEDKPTGGWDLHELRSVQDWHVRFALLGVEGVSEVASVGGYVQQYQVDVDPDAMRAAGVSLEEIIDAVRLSNTDVGAQTIEINKVEYIIRGLGFVKTLEDIENAVVKVNGHVPICVKHVARVTLGPGVRRGVLDKEGTEVVGGVVVARYGENPLATIKNVKRKIEEINPGLPRKTLADGTMSQVRLVPFYDRSVLIQETLGTLSRALLEQILITMIIVLAMRTHLRTSLLISTQLPLAVLLCFIAMKTFGVDANIVALSGIAIAIGTVVDMGIVLCDNILTHLQEAAPGEDRLAVVYRASSEVGGAVLTAVATTIVGFLPVFAMVGPEGKLFRPLAFTKTFALLASIAIALTVIPSLAHLFLGEQRRRRTLTERTLLYAPLLLLGAVLALKAGFYWAGGLLILWAIYGFSGSRLPAAIQEIARRGATWAVIGVVVIVLASRWLPLGPDRGLGRNVLFVALLILGLLLPFYLIQRFYSAILGWCLRHKLLFLSLPALLLLLGGVIWLGFDAVFGWLPSEVSSRPAIVALRHEFPGLGREFMPPLDEGSYLYMPTTMPHASIGEAIDVLRKQDIALRGIPEVESVVGKIGRAESPLDPAPISMTETVITYRTEFLSDASGKRLSYKFVHDETDFFRDVDGQTVAAPDGIPYVVQGRFVRDEMGQLIPDKNGKPFRLWRPALETSLNPGRKTWEGIKKPDHIWDAIVKAAQIPGSTSAPRLQPIAARIVMLQSGMRAPMGVKIKGPTLESIERTAGDVANLLKQVYSIEPSAVIEDRIVGKPYLEIAIDRHAIARYGLRIND